MIKSENRSRTLINVIGAPLLLSVIYFGGVLFDTFIFLVIFLCTKELNSIIKIKGFSLNLFLLYFIYLTYYFLTIFSPALNVDSLGFHIKQQPDIFLLGFSILFILIFEIFRTKYRIQNIIYNLLGFFWIGFGFQGAIFLRNLPEGMEIIYLIFLSVWMCDSSAFIFGSRYGKQKIIPKISPNKTWVGTISGYIFSTLLIYFLLKINFLKPNLLYVNSVIGVLIMGFLVGVIGQIGDFFESIIKRKFGVKDSGTLLRGHGGVLDRFDSLLFVVPAFSIYFYYLIIIS